jgi:hypothetical protein
LAVVGGWRANLKVGGVVVAILAAALAAQQNAVVRDAGSRGALGPVGVPIAQEINLYVIRVNQAQLTVGGEIKIALSISRRQGDSPGPGFEADERVGIWWES